jgi:ribosomal protein L35
MSKVKAGKVKSYKIKTHTGAKKRFRLTGTGKVVRSHAYMNHILTKKAKDKKRHLRKSAIADVTNAKRIVKLIPYK